MRLPLKLGSARAKPSVLRVVDNTMTHGACMLWRMCTMMARPDCGIALIRKKLTAAWSGSNNFRYHVWWLSAALHMERGWTLDKSDRHDYHLERCIAVKRAGGTWTWTHAGNCC
jgi:hypothetical protein